MSSLHTGLPNGFIVVKLLYVLIAGNVTLCNLILISFVFLGNFSSAKSKI